MKVGETVTVVSIVALYYLQLDWLKLISRLPDLGKTFGLLALLDFHDFGLTLEQSSRRRSIRISLITSSCDFPVTS